MKTYTWKFDQVVFINRWRDKKWLPISRRWGAMGTMTVIGIERYWAGPQHKCVRFCFFGLELSFWSKQIEKV